MTSNCSAKRTSKEAERENARHRRQEEEERVDPGYQEELHRRDQPALFVKPLHRQVNIERDDAEQDQRDHLARRDLGETRRDRKSTRLNSSHPSISYAVFCLKKKT